MKHILKLARGYWNTYKYLFNLFRGYYAYPYIKSVIIVIVSIFCLAILIQICKEVGFLPAQKIFDFLNQWAIVLSASVMLMLAGAAVWAIMDNRHGRIVDRRERRLNEIIEWATQILECGRDPAYTRQRLNLTGKSLTTFEFDLNIAIQSAFNVLSWRAVHIGFLAQHSIGNKGLKDAVEDTRTLIRQQSKLLSLASARKLKDRAAIGRHRKKVDDNAKKVIELAVKLL